MHARLLAELAVHLSVQAESFLANASRFSAAGLEQYWTASKCRFERWALEFKHHRERTAVAGRNLQALLWHELRPTLDEILASEVLTRVWTAVCCLHDRAHGVHESEAIAYSVYVGHLEARNRVLHIMVNRHAMGPDEALAINRLRRRCENWVDLLLAWFPQTPELARLSFHPQRTAEFAYELREERGTTSFGRRGDLALASLRASLAEGMRPECPNPEWNGRLASALLACFPGDFFDATGAFKSLWQTRLENVARDTQGLLAELLHQESPCPTTAPYTSPRRF